MTPQLGMSPMIIILMTLEMSFMLPETSIMLQENNYCTGIMIYNHHIFIGSNKLQL